MRNAPYFSRVFTLGCRGPAARECEENSSSCQRNARNECMVPNSAGILRCSGEWEKCGVGRVRCRRSGDGGTRFG